MTPSAPSPYAVLREHCKLLEPLIADGDTIDPTHELSTLAGLVSRLLYSTDEELDAMTVDDEG